MGEALPEHLASANHARSGGTIFTYEVNDPGRYGVVALEGDRVTGIVEKPADPPSNCAITGLYFLDADASRRARNVEPSERGELEIVSLLESYLEEGVLSVEKLSTGIEWFDAGTHDALLEAGQAVQRLQKSGELFGSPDGAAFSYGWSAGETVESALLQLGNTNYGLMLGALVKNGVGHPVSSHLTR